MFPYAHKIAISLSLVALCQPLGVALGQQGKAATSSAGLRGPREKREAASNYESFRRHFASFLSGHAEGVFYVQTKECRVYLGPDERFEAVGYLQQGDFIHALSLKDGWVKIGRAQYVRLRDVRTAGLKTLGLEGYRP